MYVTTYTNKGLDDGPGLVLAVLLFQAERRVIHRAGGVRPQLLVLLLHKNSVVVEELSWDGRADGAWAVAFDDTIYFDLLAVIFGFIVDIDFLYPEHVVGG